MFDKYSYKTKFRALLLLTVMLAFTAYKRSFSSLMDVISENTTLSEKSDRLKRESKDINTLEAEIVSINKVIGKGGTDKEKIQQDIIDFVAGENRKLSINDLKSIHTFADDNHIAYTIQLDVTGNINQLLALAYDFERRFEQSRIVSAKFYTSKKNNKPDVLHLNLIFQNYENSK